MVVPWDALGGFVAWDAGVEDNVHKASEWAPKLWVHKYTHVLKFLRTQGVWNPRKVLSVSLIYRGPRRPEGLGLPPQATH